MLTAPLPRRVFTRTCHRYLFEHRRGRFVLLVTLHRILCDIFVDPNLHLQDVEPTPFSSIYYGCSATTTGSSTAATSAAAAIGHDAAPMRSTSGTRRRWE